MHVCRRQVPVQCLCVQEAGSSACGCLCVQCGEAGDGGMEAGFLSEKKKIGSPKLKAWYPSDPPGEIHKPSEETKM